MLAPDYYFDSIYDIPYQKLYNENFRGLVFDIDNTLTAYDEALPPAKSVALIKRLQHMGFQVFLLTNNTNERLRGFNVSLQLPGIGFALKPLARGLRKAMKSMGTTPSSTVMIGDQLLSDVWAGKNARVTTILVKPITEKDFTFVRVKRVLERRLLRRYLEGHKKSE